MSSGDEGWTDGPTLLLEYRVLRQVAAGESSAARIAVALETDEDEVSYAFNGLADEGWVGFPPNRGDVLHRTAYVTGRGHAVVREWDGASASRIRRACAAAILSWLDAREGPQDASTEEFRCNVRGYYFGVPFTNETIWDAVNDLIEHGLMKAESVFGDPAAFAEITPLGQAVLTQHHGDIPAWLAATSARTGGDTFHISNSTGVTVANRSPGAQQSVHVTTDAREQVLNVASALDQMTPSLGLAPADVARAAGLVGQLREAAEVVEEEPEKARRLLGTVKDIAVNGTGSAAGTALVALVEAVVQSL
jgi:hypothetical protein